MGRMKYGIHQSLEDEADRLIRESMKGVFSHKAKSDILTPWKQADRRRREVFTAQGFPDASVRKGMFHRAANSTRPDLNSRDGIARARRVSTTLVTHVEEYGSTPRD